jgi:hypothetical protein
MKTPLQTHLATIAPSICIETIWEHDIDLHDIRKDYDGFENEDPSDWQAWQSEIQASTIVGGETITGSAYLGGTWEKAGDHPSESNPEISGYEAGMIHNALSELHGLTPEGDAARLEVSAAIDAVEAWMKSN